MNDQHTNREPFSYWHAVSGCKKFIVGDHVFLPSPTSTPVLAKIEERHKNNVEMRSYKEWPYGTTFRATVKVYSGKEYIFPVTDGEDAS